MKSVPIPETNEYNGSGGGSNGINFTLPFAQHNPLASNNNTVVVTVVN